VIEQGTHDELLKADGHYAKLLAAQDIGTTDDDSTRDSKEDEKKAVDHDLTTHTSLSKIPTKGQSTDDVTDETGTLEYPLIKCIWIMLSEQKSLYVYFVFATLACFTAGATSPGQALIFSRLLTVFALPRDEGRSEANFYALMFFVIALGNLVAFFSIGILCNTIGQEVTHRYRKEMFTNMLRQDMVFFNLPGNTSGALTSKLSAFPTQLQDLIGANILLILNIVVGVVSSSILAIAYGWKLGLVVVFGGLPPLITAGWIRIRLETTLEANSSARFSDSASLANEAVNAIKTISSLTLESSILQKYNDILSGILKTSFSSLLWTIGWYALSQSIDMLVIALGFWYGAKLLAEGEYNTSQFYIIFIGVIFAGQQAAQFFSYSSSITQATGAANYILWLRSRKLVMQETPEC
jgi:ATP-binding cassette subfamily B (MDR/TAP) protein 1